MFKKVNLKCPKCGHFIRNMIIDASVATESIDKNQLFECWCGDMLRAEPTKNYWGWIPRLSHEFYFRQNKYDITESPVPFKHAILDDIGEVIKDSNSFLTNSGGVTPIGKDKYSLERDLSDDSLENFINGNTYLKRFGRKHEIILTLKRGDYTFDADISIRSPIDKSELISGLAQVYSTGIVEYHVTNAFEKPSQFKYSPFNFYRYYDAAQRLIAKIQKQPNDNICDEYIYAMQLHKIVRDIFHRHVHHSTDLLLPPVDAKDLDDAAIKIAELFFSKFVNYKRFAGPPIATRQAIENLLPWQRRD